MHFNPSKCNILSTRPGIKGHHHHFYVLYGVILKEVETAKYLGVLLSNTLSCPGLDAVATRVNQKLGFIRRNLRGSPLKSKCMAYTTLVRKGVEYDAPIWDPATKKDINKLETVQRRAARWAKYVYYDRSTSVTKLLHELKWAELAQISKIIVFVQNFEQPRRHSPK